MTDNNTRMKSRNVGDLFYINLSIKSRTCLSEQREILIHQLVISLNLHSEREKEHFMWDIEIVTVGYRDC